MLLFRVVLLVLLYRVVLQVLLYRVLLLRVVLLEVLWQHLGPRLVVDHLLRVVVLCL